MQPRCFAENMSGLEMRETEKCVSDNNNDDNNNLIYGAICRAVD